MYQNRIFSPLKFFAQFSGKENRQISAEAVYLNSHQTNWLHYIPGKSNCKSNEYNAKQLDYKLPSTVHDQNPFKPQYKL